MRRIGLIPCLGAVMALPACILTHGLGETAEETGSSAGTGSETDPEPSGTSGNSQSGTSVGDPTATGQVPGTGTDDATDDANATDGDPSCAQDPDYVRWQPNGTSFSPLAGVDASFVAILDGQCTVGEISVATPEVGDPVWSVPLQCTVHGRIDGDAEVEGGLAPVIELTGTVDYNEVTQALGDEVRLKLVLDWWGMGWNGWLVLENASGLELLDLVQAEYVDPISSTWSEQVGDVMPGPWRSNLAVGVAESECGGPQTKCNEEPRALNVGIGPDFLLLLHEGQEGIMQSQGPSDLYRASVTSASATPEPTCTDMPLADYGLAMWILPQ